MKTQHTPGPWELVGPILSASENDKGFRICAAKGSRSVWIADSSPAIKNDRGNASDEGHANARLIAAAPELLDHCKRALDAWTGDGPPIFLDDLRAVIAKATGTDK